MQPDADYGEEFKGKEDEELRLTSTDDDNDEKNGEVSDDDGIERRSSDGKRPKIKSEFENELNRDIGKRELSKGDEENKLFHCL